MSLPEIDERFQEYVKDPKDNTFRLVYKACPKCEITREELLKINRKTKQHPNVVIAMHVKRCKGRKPKVSEQRRTTVESARAAYNERQEALNLRLKHIEEFQLAMAERLEALLNEARANNDKVLQEIVENSRNLLEILKKLL